MTFNRYVTTLQVKRVDSQSSVSVVAVPDEGYTCNRSCILDWLSTLLTWSVVTVSDEGYACNRSCNKRVNSQSSVHGLLHV
jgi:hypothetical protein